MLFSTDGTPLKEVLQAAALRRATKDNGPKPTPYLPDQNAPDGRAQRTLRNRLGDVYRVFRDASIGGRHPKHVTWLDQTMPEITALAGVGRPPGTPVKACRQFEPVPTLNDRLAQGLTVEKVYQGMLLMGCLPEAVYADAVTRYGSQRKAAVALGISLGKLQRGLRKAR